MKIYPNILSGISDCLKNILLLNKYTADVLDQAFRNNKKWGSRDRRFIGESVFDIVRWRKLFEHLADTNSSDTDYCEKLIAIYLLKSGHTLPETYSKLISWELGNEKIYSETFSFAIKESIPEWLNELGKTELPHIWEREIESLNEQAKVFLRVNTLKINTIDLQEKLKILGIETSTKSNSPACLILNKRQALNSLQEFKDGLFEIQDLGSQEITPFMKLEPGMNVIDACAGAGGKTLHMASLLKNTGKIISMDIVERKLKTLKERALRAGAKNIETRTIQSETVDKLKNTADRLLLDVPCSGLGVLKRNPDTKWKLTKEEIESTISVQSQILSEYSSMLKVGGIMVYATCSILPSENEKQIESFINNKNSCFILEDEKHIWPSEGADGFYMARMKKIK
ncbi:MAG: methyltransferase domain-containing protein [Opitutaceae bacterium]|nr:methyltransferase domain-containing protein [Cytophagales bacterium]